jgi:uncharacterized protein YcbK (DUF882 family)
MLRLLLLLLAVTVGSQAAGAEKDASGKVASRQRVVAAKASHGRRAVKRVKSVRRVAKHRGKRRGKMIGWPVPEKALLASPPDLPSGKLRIYSVNYKEEADVNIYNPDGSFNVKALAEISHVFKCRRSGLEHDIDTRLITILSHVYDHFGGKRIELLSGYRFQRRTTSNHFHGAAADIRIAGVNPRKIRSYVESLDAGGMGVGWYPRVGFVHVDVREPPSYRWIDYSHSNPHSRDRLPPRGFKRKNPQS